MKCKKTFIALLCVLLFMLDTPRLYAEKQGEEGNNELNQLSKTEYEVTSKKYSDYLLEHEDKQLSLDSVELPIKQYELLEGDVHWNTNLEGRACLVTEDNSSVSWKFKIDREGFYQIFVEYLPVEGKASAIERAVYLDGEIPFLEASSIQFKRIWTNKTEIVKDSRGNDIRPLQVESARWCSDYVNDATGLYNEPLKFYLSKGEHTLTMEGVREPMGISSICFRSKETTPTYEEVSGKYDIEELSKSKPIPIIIEGETAKYKSDSMLYPINDRSSVATSPSDPAKIRYNTIGGVNWKMVGDWLEWEFSVDQSGYYQIGIKARQNINSGLNSYRSLRIDGQSVCKELDKISFPYNTEWEMFSLGEKENPYLIYLEKGSHTINLMSVIGDMETVIIRVTDSISELNEIYRKILVITGSNADIYRDYEFEKKIPDTVENIGVQAKILKEIYESLVEGAGQQGENVQVFKKLYLQMEQMYKDPRKIAKQFSQFKDNIAALGTWYNTAKEQPLEVDYMVISPYGDELPSINKSLLAEINYGIKSFLASFVEDYNSIGESGEDPITVWVGNGVTGGRDQVQVLKQIITEDFTKKTGINVNLKLVPMGSLLSATMAGIGPDVALTVGGAEAINYAVRNAVTDLTQFDDFEQVVAQFDQSAMTPLSFREGVYGLPESQTYYMMFYRKDILSEQDIAVPKTWDDLINILPVLQKSNMNFGLPIPMSDVGVGVGFPAYMMFLSQNDGTLYEEDGKFAYLDSEKSIDAFEMWTDFYLSYGLETNYDAANRFRTGDYPIVIADFSLFNQLKIFAPEINGLWEMTTIPGTKNEKGVINNSDPSNISASIILEKSEKKKEAWEFLKWWTGTDAQVQFARALESILGPSGRYSPANLDAFEQIPWDKKTYDLLMKQRKSVFGIPEVPGSYYASRYVDFAFKKINNEKIEPYRVLTDMNVIVNDEITQRRKDFGIIE